MCVLGAKARGLLCCSCGPYELYAAGAKKLNPNAQRSRSLAPRKRRVIESRRNNLSAVLGMAHRARKTVVQETVLRMSCYTANRSNDPLIPTTLERIAREIGG